MTIERNSEFNIIIGVFFCIKFIKQRVNKYRRTSIVMTNCPSEMFVDAEINTYNCTRRNKYTWPHQVRTVRCAEQKNKTTHHVFMFYQSCPDIADTPPSIWQKSDKRTAEKLRKTRILYIFPWYPNFHFIAMYWLVLPCNGFSFAKTVVCFRYSKASDIIRNQE